MPTFALPHRELVEAAVSAQNFAGGGDDFAGILGHLASLLLLIILDEADVVAAGYKADFLAFRLFGDRELRAASDVADFGLTQSAQRKLGVR